MRVRFLDTCTVEAQGEIVETFNKGEVYELGTQSALRWMRRNLAVEVQGAPTPAPKKRGRPKKVTTASGKASAKVGKTSAVLGDTKAAPKRDDSDTGLGAKPDAGSGQSVSKPDSSGDK